ncbi:MAG: BACON domain-containing protein [Bacteroidales bacterium]|nr:BACON domain-containing protein [Bacteroidales bacterium]
MKTIFKTVACMSLLLLSLSACQEFKIDTQMTPEKEAASVRLESDALESYTISATNPQPISFKVASNTPWTISRSDNAEWLAVSPASSSVSSLNVDVTVNAVENTTYEDRSVTLTISAEKVDKTYTVVITQNRLGKLFVQPVTDALSALGADAEFTIETNLPWEVHSSEAWLTFDETSGEAEEGIKTITATAEASNVIERKATVTVTAGADTETFEVIQKGKLIVVPVADAIVADGGSQDFTIETDLPWEARSSEMWLNLDKTSGEGDGSVITVKATADPNTSIMRKAKVTVTVGGKEETFDVTQKGMTLEIVPPAETAIDRTGGELILDVDASMEWEPVTDTEWITVEKLSATQFKVTGAWNNKFAPRTGVVAVKPVSTSYGDVKSVIELTQDINFKFEGDYVINEDGSIRINSGVKTRVTTLDNFRYASMTLKFGDVNFGTKGELWAVTNAAGCNIYNQLSLGGNLRIRQDGNLPNSGKSTYKNQSLSGMNQEALNAMTEYRFEVVPDGTVDPSYDNVFYHFVRFWYNGTLNTELNFRSVYEDDPTAAGAYWFGFYNTVTDGTWYVVKSCDITVYPEGE